MSPMAAVVVSWSPGSDRALALRLIQLEAHRFFGLPEAHSRITNHCRSCGSTRHGRPTLLPIRGAATPHVSISRTRDLTVVALTESGPIGVDVERRDAGFTGLDGVTAHELEASSDTITWVRKESLLKAVGRGLTVDPRSIRLTEPPQPPALVSWADGDPPAAPVWMLDIEITAHHVAALTVLSGHSPDVVVRRADPEARRLRASR